MAGGPKAGQNPLLHGPILRKLALRWDLSVGADMSTILKFFRPAFCAVLFAVTVTHVCAEPSLNIRSRLADSDLHALAGLSIGFLAAGAASSLDIAAPLLTTISLASALLAGLAKEMIDFAGYGSPEIRDFFNTALGGAVATAGIIFASYALSPYHRQPSGSMALYLPLGLIFLIPLVANL